MTGKCDYRTDVTGNATVTRCYNTCFTIKTGKNILLVDAEVATAYWDS